MITSDQAQTRLRIAKLRGYLTENVLDDTVVGPPAFVCRYGESCKKSHRQKNGDSPYHEGQLHYVGEHYDLKVNGVDVRVAIIGQEYGFGDPGRVHLDGRRKMVMIESGGKSFSSRNPHMKGTTNLLRIIFGRWPAEDDRNGESVEIDGKRIHVFDCFALTNYLLCMAGSLRLVRSRWVGRANSTGFMQMKCAEHFRRVFEILEPTLVIVQGLGVRNWLGGNVTEYGLSAEQRKIEDVPVLEAATINDRSVPLVAFGHPTYFDQKNGHKYRWSNPDNDFLLNTVRDRVIGLCARAGFSLWEPRDQLRLQL